MTEMTYLTPGTAGLRLPDGHDPKRLAAIVREARQFLSDTVPRSNFNTAEYICHTFGCVEFCTALQMGALEKMVNDVLDNHTFCSWYSEQVPVGHADDSVQAARLQWMNEIADDSVQAARLQWMNEIADWLETQA